MKFKYIYIAILFVLSLGSCSKWIDVKPADRLAEDVLYSDKSGYVKALNGVYSELTNNKLYGRFLSASAVDVLAQYYVFIGSTNAYFNYTVFDYTQKATKDGFDDTWQKAYEQIVNLNVIISRCGDAPSNVLPETYYNVIKGEALALRAMLHLDMLRLFGPIWSETNKNLIAIPYTLGIKNEITPLLTSEEVLSLVESDLNQAIVLLQASDPIIREGVRNESNLGGVNDFYYRQYRLNYFAAKALLARAYLWKGDKAKALANAKEVIQAAKINGRDIFPFVTGPAATSPDKPDRMFSTEVLFSLFASNRGKLYEEVFAADRGKDNRLAFNNGDSDMARANEMYDDKNDYRYKIWEQVTVEGKSILTNQKFKDYSDASGRYMIPLIRISEMYLIVAECAPDFEEAKAAFNRIRNARNVFNLNPADVSQLKKLITSEYRKEFIGEGQMFFYYKRNAATMLPNSAVLVGEKSMPLNNYVVPLPDSEIRMRPAKNL